MKIRLMMAAAALAGLFALPAAAEAANAYAVTDVNMRAGPGVQFPRIATIPAGAAVAIHSCTRQWTWCDTTWRYHRGWVSARYLQTVYEGHRVYLYERAPFLGLPIITYRVGPYWDRWYRDRPFYNERPRFDRRWRELRRDHRR